MRNYLLGAVALLATLTGDTLAQSQSSNDRRLRWIGVTNDSKSDVFHIEIIPSSSKSCCWSRDLLEYEILEGRKRKGRRRGNTILLDFDNGSGKCEFDILASAGEPRGRHWYFKEFNVCSEVALTLKDASDDGKDRSMMVRNESGVTAWYAYTIPKDLDCCRSHDLLGASAIGRGASHRIDFDDGNRRCLFDILVRGGSQANSITRDWYFEGVDVCDQTELTLKEVSGDGKDRRLMVRNESELFAWRTYAIPSGRDCCWSRELFGTDWLRPRSSLPVNFDDGSGTCRFDILVRGGTRKRLTREWYLKDIDVCSTTELRLGVSSGDSKDRRMTLRNNSSLTAARIYAIPSDRDCCWARASLERDELEKDAAIPPERSRTVDFDDGSGECEFDLRITSDGPGLEWNFDRVDVCGGSKTITLK